MVVIITRVMVLSSAILVISGLIYCLRGIFLFRVFNSKGLFIQSIYKSSFLNINNKKLFRYTVITLFCYFVILLFRYFVLKPAT